MAVSMTRKTLWWTVAGVAVAVLALGVAVFFPDRTPDDNSQTQSGAGNQQAGAGGINIQSSGDVVLEFQRRARDVTVEEAKEIAKKYATIPPTPGEPAAFMIVGAPRHLWVRSSGDVNGRRIGAVYNSSIVWTDCRSATGFDPEKTDDTGDEWLRIRWYTDKPNTNPGNSEPSGQYPGWVYAGYTVPAGHNGDVPACDGT